MVWFKMSTRVLVSLKNNVEKSMRLEAVLYSPRNDPQIDPKMIPISLHVNPEMIPS